MNCIFCDLLRKNNKDIIYSDEDFFCVKDIKPKASFHILFITRMHFQDIFELYKQDKDLYIKFFERSTEMISKYYKKTECRYTINTGKSAGQEIDHLHMHIMSWQ